MTKREFIEALEALDVEDSKEIFIDTVFIRSAKEKYISIRYYSPFIEIQIPL